MLRVIVQRFADAMVQRLVANQYKGHWGDCSDVFLLSRCSEQYNKLRLSVVWLRHDQSNDGVEAPLRREAFRRAVLRHAVNLANYAMMVADNCGTLADIEASKVEASKVEASKVEASKVEASKS